MKRFCRRDESGFTLVELLVAIAILMIGLVAVMQSFPLGTAGVETGRRQSTAVFLAEQKIEQIKAWGLSTSATQGFANVAPGGTCYTSVNPRGPCNNDNFNTIPGYPEYQRTVILQCLTTALPPNPAFTVVGPPCPATSTARLVRVQVQYRRVTTQGVLTAGQQVDIATVIAQH
jgi:prepilin-type N-terminal cleavage/methylation domain-containing protein